MAHGNDENGMGDSGKWAMTSYSQTFYIQHTKFFYHDTAQNGFTVCTNTIIR